MDLQELVNVLPDGAEYKNVFINITYEGEDVLIEDVYFYKSYDGSIGVTFELKKVEDE